MKAVLRFVILCICVFLTSSCFTTMYLISSIQENARCGVTTSDKVAITSEGAIVGGTYDKSKKIIEAGAIYWNKDDPSNKMQVRGHFIEKGEVKAEIKGLSFGNVYCYVIYIRREDGKIAHEDFSTCKEFEPFPKGPVDFHLPSGIKWDIQNIGANSPMETGPYYSWGEVASKHYYDLGMYSMWDPQSRTFSKYTRKDNLVELNDSDDVVRVTKGGHWRMPTAEDIQELSRYCVYTPASINGISGVKVTSKIDPFDRNYIFFPLSGYKISNVTYNEDDVTCWTKSLQSDDSAYSLIINSVFSIDIISRHRQYGMPIRAVYDETM